jgi:chemotaxis family two-component system response regulator Rcp1
MQQTTAIEILLVEDNPGDVRLTQEALQEARVVNRLHVVEDGAAALAFFHKKPPFDDAPTPDLVLLDLNLPKVSGREVLETIKKHPDFKQIPVVILTSSQAEEDILRSYDLHANAFVTKPVDFEGFVDVLRRIESFWLAVVKLPTTAKGPP